MKLAQLTLIIAIVQFYLIKLLLSFYIISQRARTWVSTVLVVTKVSMFLASYALTSPRPLQNLKDSSYNAELLAALLYSY